MNGPEGQILPAADTLNEYESKFVLSNLAAKRAKQIKEGAPPLVRPTSNHPLTVALEEIASGKIQPIVSAETIEPVDAGELEAALPTTDLGILLPALEDTEATELGVAALVGDEHEEEVEGVAPTASLSDLLDETEVDAEQSLDSEEDTLSLSDIAEQENMDEEEENQE